jgi:hypothetical protein
VLLKGRQSSQITTMLHNECKHTFLYVFGHLGGGVSPTLLCAGAVCVDIVEV